MSYNLAIVDDQHESVIYSDHWVNTGTSNEFNRTTKAPVQNGATASVNFVGNSVTVYGTIANSTVVPPVNMTFLIDGTVQGVFNPLALATTSYQSVFWASPQLEEGNHTLLITAPAVENIGILFFDYILFNTTAIAPTVDTYFVDDRDSRVVYQPSWTVSDSQADFMHTSQKSPSQGASLELEFDGRGVSVFGPIITSSSGQVMNASFSVDGGIPIFFVPPTQESDLTTNNLIFSTGTTLTDERHKLVVTAMNDNPVAVDYFLVVPPLVPAAAAPSPPLPSGSSKSPLIGAYVGAALGGLLLLALVAFAVYAFLRRRRTRKLQRENLRGMGIDPEPGRLTITPWRTDPTDFPPASASASSSLSTTLVDEKQRGNPLLFNTRNLIPVTLEDLPLGKRSRNFESSSSESSGAFASMPSTPLPYGASMPSTPFPYGASTPSTPLPSGASPPLPSTRPGPSMVAGGSPAETPVGDAPPPEYVYYNPPPR